MTNLKRVRAAELLFAIGLPLVMIACSSTQGANSASPANGADAASTAPSNNAQNSAPITLPAGTRIPVTLDQSISSAQQRSGDKFDASLSVPIEVDGAVVIPKGARVTGRVVAARSSGRLSTPAHLELALATVEVGGNSVPVETASLNFSGPNHKKHNLIFIGGGTGLGALIGGLAGGGKGALIGSAAGAGAGTATAAATGKHEVILDPESRLTFRLTQPITLQSKS